jgi:hypothetical protein
MVKDDRGKKRACGLGFCLIQKYILLIVSHFVTPCLEQSLHERQSNKLLLRGAGLV